MSAKSFRYLGRICKLPRMRWEASSKRTLRHSPPRSRTLRDCPFSGLWSQYAGKPSYSPFATALAMTSGLYRRPFLETGPSIATFLMTPASSSISTLSGNAGPSVRSVIFSIASASVAVSGFCSSCSPAMCLGISSGLMPMDRYSWRNFVLMRLMTPSGS